MQPLNWSGCNRRASWPPSLSLDRWRHCNIDEATTVIRGLPPCHRCGQRGWVGGSRPDPKPEQTSHASGEIPGASQGASGCGRFVKGQDCRGTQAGPGESGEASAEIPGVGRGKPERSGRVGGTHPNGVDRQRDCLSGGRQRQSRREGTGAVATRPYPKRQGCPARLLVIVCDGREWPSGPTSGRS